MAKAGPGWAVPAPQIPIKVSYEVHRHPAGARALPRHIWDTRRPRLTHYPHLARPAETHAVDLEAPSRAFDADIKIKTALLAHLGAALIRPPRSERFGEERLSSSLLTWGRAWRHPCYHLSLVCLSSTSTVSTEALASPHAEEIGLKASTICKGIGGFGAAKLAALLHEWRLSLERRGGGLRS